MPMPTRRARPSISSPTSLATGADDISHLTLQEVRSRLARNTATLSSPIFNPPQQNITTPPASGFGSGDAAKDKLLAARESLLAREQELLAEVDIQDEDMSMEQNGESSTSTSTSTFALGAGRRQSDDAGISGLSPQNGYKSGKQRALEVIRQGEGKLVPGGIILPIDQTLSLSSRDYSNQTAYHLSQLSLNINHTRSSSPKPRLPINRHPESASPNSKGKGKQRHLFTPSLLDPAGTGGGEDEISRASRLARLNAFMSYKGSLSDDEDDDDDDDDDDDEEYIKREERADERNFPLAGVADGGYDGNGLPSRQNNGNGNGTGDVGVGVDDIGEEVDEFGEDDEVYAEGNDEYNLAGGEDIAR